MQGRKVWPTHLFRRTAYTSKTVLVKEASGAVPDAGRFSDV